MERLNLRNTTFIIPLYLESEDRKLNLHITLAYLSKHLDTNIIILEHDTVSKVPQILENLNLDTNIKYVFSENKAGNDIFHRTRFLNEMLDLVETQVVVNYDVDILLRPDVYFECQEKILDGSDLIYPYFWGDSQYQIHSPGRHTIHTTNDIDLIAPQHMAITRSEYGHCQFFSTKSYREGGMENENFISYGPEDKERGYRFQKLGYKVEWLNNMVYHIEHSRGVNSSSANPHMANNNNFLSQVQSYTEGELRHYYDNIGYLSKYSNQHVVPELISEPIPEPYVEDEKNIANKIFHEEVQRWFEDDGDLTHRLSYDLTDNSNIIDVGGYRGEWAAAMFANHMCNIEVFEPVSEYWQFIHNRFLKNTKIIAHKSGLSHKTETIDIVKKSQESSMFIEAGDDVLEAIYMLDINDHLANCGIVDLIKINIEGSEYDIFENISDDSLNKLKNIQIQFHSFVDNCITRRDAIRERLAITHDCTYCYDFVWENWRLK